MNISVTNIVGLNLINTEGIPCFEGPLGDSHAIIDRHRARRLTATIGLSLGTHSRIGILSNHRVETYVSAVTCVLGGLTFVPLNPKFPTERLRRIAQLGDIDVILFDDSTEELYQSIFQDYDSLNVSDLSRDECTPNVAEEWIAQQASRFVNRDDIAYIMFTSGSTGDPKGVPVSFGSLSSYIAGISERLHIAEGLRFSQFFDLSFDLSIHDIFLSQYLCGTLIAPKPIDLMMPTAYLARESIDVWFSVPILGAILGRAKRKAEYKGLLHILFCGEALPIEVVAACRSHLAVGGRIWNLYGPTEATIAFTAGDVTDSIQETGTATIGFCFGDNHVGLLIDGKVIENPEVGDEGELLLGGPQVFNGYSTEAPSPFVQGEHHRFYKSGDLVRFEESGITYKGRTDSQIKWRGYRIELGEIETAIRSEFNLKTVAVVVSQNSEPPTLQAWCLKEEVVGLLDLQRLSRILPDYMIPEGIHELDEMPVNANGKIDRKALSHTRYE